ncbi:MAG: hypothetical protein OHK0050_18240 [Roseiflexaceae bacterium]
MPHPADLLTAERLITLAEELVRIPSVTGNEQPIAEYLHGHLSRCGLTTRRLAVEEAGESIVGWLDGDEPGPTLMLNFHLDTFEAFAGWQTDPFTPARVGDRLYGLGSHDMKGGAACVLATVEAISQAKQPFKGRLLVSATSDEENWSRGAHALIRTGLLEGCIGALVPEPAAAGTLTIGQRGRHVFRVRFAGRTIHAAFGRGINAVADAARVAARLSDPAAVDLGWSEQFGLAGTLCVIGLHGGGSMILVPEQAELLIDRHILPGETVDHAAAQIRSVIETCQLESQWELTWDHRPTPAPTAFVVPADSRLVTCVRQHLAREQNQPIKLVLGRSVADTNHFAVHGGVPTLICGPQGGNTCEANEYLELPSLLPTARAITASVVDLLSA